MGQFMKGMPQIAVVRGMSPTGVVVVRPPTKRSSSRQPSHQVGQVMLCLQQNGVGHGRPAVEWGSSREATHEGAVRDRTPKRWGTSENASHKVW